MLIALALTAPHGAWAQEPSDALRYVYDGAGHLKTVTDPGSETATLNWDPVGNLLSVGREDSTELSIADFTPRRAPAGATVTILGTGFASGAGSVQFNGLPASVTELTDGRIAVTVPSGATTGPLTVTTAQGSVSSAQAFVVGEEERPTIASATPSVAAAGDTLTISGANFDAQRAGNLVTISGTRARVLDASTTTLHVEIPSVTASGQLAVATNQGRAVGPDLFVAPSGVSPADVVNTGRITAGTREDVSVATGKTAIRVVDAVEDKRLSLKVTGSSAAGTISIFTPSGAPLTSASFSSGDGVVEPVDVPATGTYAVVIRATSSGGSLGVTPYTFDDQSEDVSLSAAGTARTWTFDSPGERGMLRFEGHAGQRLSTILTQNALNGSGRVFIRFLKPDGTAFMTDWWTSQSGPINEAVLPVDGTYTVVVDPDAATTGTVSLTSYDASDTAFDLSEEPTEQGVSNAVAITAPGQNTQLRFEGEEGQRLMIAVTGGGISSSSYLRSPSGANLAGVSASAGSTIDPITLPADGTYSIVVDGSGSATGSVTFTFYSVPEDESDDVSFTPAGAARTWTFDSPGRLGMLRFEGHAGQRLSTILTQNALNGSGRVFIRFLKPDGTAFMTDWWTSQSGPINEAVLPVDGTYTVVVDPDAATTGTVSLSLYNASDTTVDLGAAPSDAGVSKAVEITAPGQNSSLRFEGEEGQRIFVRATSGAINASASVRSPSGTPLTALSPSAGSSTEPLTLPADGIYSIFVDGSGSSTGSVTFTISTIAEDFSEDVAFSAAGVTRTWTLDSPGQRAKLRFDGQAGQRLSTVLTQNALNGNGRLFIRFLKPDGTEFMSDWWTSQNNPINEAILPVTGTYTVIVDPDGAATGTVSLGLYNASDTAVDFDAAPSTAGSAKSVALTTPGANVRARFTGQAGQRVLVAVESGSVSGSAYLRSPSDANLGGLSPSAGAYLDTVTLPADGTYSILIDGSGSATGTVGLKVYDVPADESEDVALDSTPLARSWTFSSPGYSGKLRFEGEAGQRLTTVLTQNALAGDGRVWIRYLNPNGSILMQDWWTTQSQPSNTAVLPVDGTYTIVVDPDGLLGGTSAITAALTSASPSARAAAAREYRFGKPEPVPAREAKSAMTAGATAKAPKPSTAPAVAAKAKATATPTPTATPAQAAAKAAPKTAPAVKPAAAPHVAKPKAIPSFDSSDAPTWLPSKRVRQGRDWVTGRGATPAADLAALRARNGVTALAGQALKVNGEPLPNVTISIEGSRSSAKTDADGRFLLANVPAGHQVLIVDGGTTRERHERYGIFEAGVDLAAHATTTLGYTIWMSALDRAGDARVHSPLRRDRVLTTPRIPGLEVRIPAGSTIRDAQGRDVETINITPVPVDRPPFPLPPHLQVPIYFTVQPGRVYLSKGAQIVYPNYTNQAPGERVDFWNYDADDRGWYIYGQGTVTTDGKQVVPDPNVRVWEFTGAMISADPAPDSGPGPCGGSDGDPVDLASGLFVYKKTDLSLQDTLPIDVTRNYRPNDSNSYSFGRGTTSGYDMRLWSVHNYQDLDLILPCGTRIHYVRTSPGTGYADAVYEAQGTPGRYLHSVITFEQATMTWHLKTTDGTEYIFGEYAPLQAIRDRYGNQITLTRAGGQTGPVTQVTSPNGRWIRFAYDGANRVTSAIDVAGRSAHYTYDAGGRLATATDPNGGVTEYEYNAGAQMTKVTDPRGIDYVANTFDADGRVHVQTLGDGGTYTFTYTEDANGAIIKTRVVDPRGGVREVTVAGGLITHDTTAVGTPRERTSTFERASGSNAVTAVTDQLGRRTQYGFDAYGRVTSTTRMAGTPQAATWSTTYAADGLVLSTSDPLGHGKHYTYDDRRRLKTIEDETGATWTVTAARRDGQPAEIKDPLDHVKTYDYREGDLVAVHDALGHTLSRELDAAGQVIAAIDATGRRTRYTYDDGGRVAKVIDPDGGETTYTHDDNGNVTGITDANGHTTSTTYDAMDRIDTYTDALGHEIDYDYDLTGNLTQVTGRRGQVTAYAYDELSRRTFAGYGRTGSAGSPSYESTIEYTYDAGDRIVGIDDSEAGTITQAYDGLSRLTSQATPDGTIGYGYDLAGRRTSMTLPGGATTTYGYDEANRMTGVTRGALGVTIAYDGVGNRTSLTLPNQVEQTFTYDAGSRLTGITSRKGLTQVGELAYGYDAAGRRTAVWGSSARTALPEEVGDGDYDAANRLVERDGQALSYDADGNLTADGTSTLAWDARGQLGSIAGASATTSFAYDGLGRRVGKTSGASTTRTLYDIWNPVVENPSSGPATTWLNGLELDEAYASTTDGSTLSRLTDALGSTVGLSDEAGASAAEYTYTPFGETTVTGASGAAEDNTRQFAGRDNDGTGLYYQRARYYSPQLGRFVSEDPLGHDGSGVNLYLYAGGSPLVNVDPTGLFWFGPTWVPNPFSGLGTAARKALAAVAPETGYVEISGFAGAILGVDVSVQIGAGGQVAVGFSGGLGVGGSVGAQYHPISDVPATGSLGISGGGCAIVCGSVGNNFNGGGNTFGEGGGLDPGIGAGVGASAGLTVGTSVTVLGPIC